MPIHGDSLTGMIFRNVHKHFLRRQRNALQNKFNSFLLFFFVFVFSLTFSE
jgi:hypothetical protein